MNENINIIENGNICSPQGFQAAGVVAGLKVSGALDMALIVSDKPAVAAGAFTTCQVQAAPVLVSQLHLAARDSFRAIIVNSGNANACTGENGLHDAKSMTEKVATGLGITPEEVFVSSTGRIGTPLPMNKINQGIEAAIAALSHKSGPDTAKAIMTTDTKPKEMAVKFNIVGSEITIGGTTKGAGMIAPKMTVPHATMLSYITTDAKIDQATLASALEQANEQSYNKISIDGDMSTNDTVIILANGMANNPVITSGSKEAEIFQEALNTITQQLAKEMVMDGEGVTKFVTVQVKNAASKQDAELVTRAISDSLLCKTAWFGCDPNWGRILAAAGYSGAVFYAEKVNLHYDGVPVIINGVDAGTPEPELVELMKKDAFVITLDLNAGSAEDEMWTNDISYEYVKINADYHT